MRLSALKHLIEATQALGHPQRIRVLGSSALLASFPELGEPGQPLTRALLRPPLVRVDADGPVGHVADGRQDLPVIIGAHLDLQHLVLRRLADLLGDHVGRVHSTWRVGRTIKLRCGGTHEAT